MTERPTITNKKVIAYCERENAMQKAVYPGRIKAGRMKQDQANEYYFIIKELRQLAVEAENRGLTWQDILCMVMEKPNPNELDFKMNML